MSLKFGLQVLLESCNIFFMKEIIGYLWDKCNFVLIYSRNAFFAPINGQIYEISNNVVCASSKGLDQPAHMCSLIRAFASRLKPIDRLAFEVSLLKRRPHRLVWAYSCQNATMSMCGSKGGGGGGGRGSRPPWKITSYSYMGFYWTPTPGKSWTPPLENV